jgi:hypothetical protein
LHSTRSRTLYKLDKKSVARRIDFCMYADHDHSFFFDAASTSGDSDGLSSIRD